MFPGVKFLGSRFSYQKFQTSENNRTLKQNKLTISFHENNLFG